MTARATMRGLIGGLTATVVATGALIAGAGAAVAAPEGESIAQRVGPSIVYLETSYVSTVNVPFDDGAEWSDPVTVTASCTGYLVDTKGSIATAGHCVDDTDDTLADEMRQAAVVALAKEQGRSEEWAQRIYARSKAEQWQVRGADGAKRTDGVAFRTVKVKQPTGDGQVITDWADADVVDFQSFDQGDNAVLRLKSAPDGLRPLVISDAEPQPGDEITAVGFPGAVSRTVGPGSIPQPSYIDGKVSSRQTRASGIVGTEISADLGKGMSGGPTVDSRARVIGTNSWKTKPVDGDTASFSFLTDNQKLRGYLEANGVQLAVPASPAGTNKLIWIVPLLVVVVLALGGAGFLVLRGRRRAATAAPVAMGPGPGLPGNGAPGIGAPGVGAPGVGAPGGGAAPSPFRAGGAAPGRPFGPTTPQQPGPQPGSPGPGAAGPGTPYRPGPQQPGTQQPGPYQPGPRQPGAAPGGPQPGTPQQRPYGGPPGGGQWPPRPGGYPPRR